MSIAIEKLTAAYELEQKNSAPPKEAGDLPLSYEAITDEWLTNVICRNTPNAEVKSHRLGPADEGNTSRRTIYLEYNETGRTAGFPSSVFCKATQQLASRISAGIPGAVHSEVSFYNKVRPLLKIEAPECIWANYNRETLNSIVILYNLGDETEFCSMKTDITEQRCREQLALLAQFHGFFYQRPDSKQLLSAFSTWPEFFDRTKSFGIEQISANGFQEAKEVIPARLFKRADEIWSATLASVALHEKLPQTLTHSDVHLRNWYISPGDKMGLNDWQCTCKGHWSRDVAYAITSSLSVERRRKLEKPLLRYYLEKLKEAGGPVSDFSTAWTHYRQQLLSVLIWWTVTMPSAELPAMQPLDFTLEMIKRISTAMDDLDSIDSIS